MTDLHQAVVLITGAAGGFGQELTRQLLRAGSRPILTDLDETVLRQQAEAISKETATDEIVACLAADLANREGCQALYDRVRTLDIPVDILINNAGIGLLGRMDEVPLDKWEQLMQVNLLAPMHLSSLFVADMIARRKGHIVNISSLAGWVAPPGLAHYAASKFGLRGFSEGLRGEVEGYNLKVTAVYPYFSRTPILQSERYGTFARDDRGFPERLATDPARVMAATIQAIARDHPYVFPDATARSISTLKRYFPRLLNWIGGKAWPLP